MKFIFIILFIYTSQYNMNSIAVQSKRISKEATFMVHASIDAAFPLFTPLGEKKWVPGWEPTFLYPENGAMEEGMVFRTAGHFVEEPDYHWIVARYLLEQYHVEYVVSTANRYWVITVQCENYDADITKTTVRYTYIGFNELGNELSEQASAKMFQNDLKDWEQAINHYLKTGTLLHNH